MMLRNETSNNSMKSDLKLATDQAEGYLTELNNLSKRLKDQRKLEDLCREQEKIISKLEDLFSKTRINIDSRWKDDVDRMIDMTRTRQRYNPDLYHIPIPKGRTEQILDVQDEIEGERHRSHILERQINEMARAHARE